jgi:type I restriction enzyme S subunit
MNDVKNISACWKYKRLGDMFDFVGGGTPSKKQTDFWNGDIFWASVKDVKGEYLNKTQDSITEKGLKNSASNIAEIGDVILITRISPGKSIITNVRTAINQDLKIARAKFKTTSKFIHYFFNSIERDCINISSGTTVLGITLNNLNELLIPDLSFEEQQAIVAKIEELLSELENGKQQLLTTQQQLKVYRQSLLKWALEGKLTNKNVKEGELPKGWKTEKLGRICEIKNGKNQKLVENPNGKYPIYGSAGKMGFADSYLCDAGSTIIGRKGTINKPLYVNEKFWNVDTAFGFMPNTDLITNRFLYFFCLSFNFAKLDKSTTIPSLAKTDLQKIDVVLPPLKEQQLIVSELESKLTACDQIEETISQSLQQAETLRQSILKKAFEGKLI